MRLKSRAKPRCARSACGRRRPPWVVAEAPARRARAVGVVRLVRDRRDVDGGRRDRGDRAQRLHPGVRAGAARRQRQPRRHRRRRHRRRCRAGERRSPRPSSTRCSRSASSTRPSPRCRRHPLTTTSGGCGSTPTSSSTGPGGATVRELVSSLDRRFRIVGTRYFNHYPDRRPEYLAGLAPARLPAAVRGAEREPLRPRPPQAPPPAMGSRRATDHFRARVPCRPCRRSTLAEPTTATFTHHFPYRLEEVTRRRLDALCGRDASGQVAGRSVRSPGATQRPDRLGHVQAVQHARRTVYARDWANVENLRRDGEHDRRRAASVDRRRRSRRTPMCARWYAPAELDAALAGWRRTADSPT